MREIKFRAWDGKEYRYPPPLGEWDWEDCSLFAGYNKSPTILEQYTGLKDKNGKEIYEGDIVKYKEWFNGFGDKYKDMEWIVEMECNKFDNETSGGADGDIWYTDIEIIGNIHARLKEKIHERQNEKTSEIRHEVSDHGKG